MIGGIFWRRKRVVVTHQEQRGERNVHHTSFLHFLFVELKERSSRNATNTVLGAKGRLMSHRLVK